MPSIELQTEIVLCLERCLQLRPFNVDALKALALFHLNIRQDKVAAVPLLERLADVRVLRASAAASVTVSIMPLTHACSQIPEHKSWALQWLKS